MQEITREDGWKLLKRYVSSPNLIQQALAVEAVMRYFAGKFDEDVELWGVIGLCHDIDYEQYPDEHCSKAVDLLSEAGWPEEYIRAVQSHGWGICSDVEPLSRMEKTLFTIDELTGLVAATALVRPSKSILDMHAKSVKKKWKAKAFSAGVDREIIEKGAKMLEMEISEEIEWTILGMRPAAEALDLAGSPEL
ncbi:MAG: HDIG domain-containing protein [Spirochaetales bacterium]|jgi:putative nucleotidyltransferase with HDIG domain|nr:HDIG domain-containing protein [Spirochaetales bacterium]